MALDKNRKTKELREAVKTLQNDVYNKEVKAHELGVRFSIKIALLNFFREIKERIRNIFHPNIANDIYEPSEKNITEKQDKQKLLSEENTFYAISKGYEPQIDLSLENPLQKIIDESEKLYSFSVQKDGSVICNTYTIDGKKTDILSKEEALTKLADIDIIPPNEFYDKSSELQETVKSVDKQLIEIEESIREMLDNKYIKEINLTDTFKIEKTENRDLQISWKDTEDKKQDLPFGKENVNLKNVATMIALTKVEIPAHDLIEKATVDIGAIENDLKHAIHERVSAGNLEPLTIDNYTVTVDHDQLSFDPPLSDPELVLKTAAFMESFEKNEEFVEEQKHEQEEQDFYDRNDDEELDILFD